MSRYKDIPVKKAEARKMSTQLDPIDQRLAQLVSATSGLLEVSQQQGGSLTAAVAELARSVSEQAWTTRNLVETAQRSLQSSETDA